MIDGTRLPIVRISGLTPDSLGNYLASLGLLRLLTRKWPSVRIAWRDHALYMVGGPASLDGLLDELSSIADKRAWTPYAHRWATEQKKSTKAKSGLPLAIWQAAAEEQELELFAVHAVPHARVSFNPLLGSGGNAGKRAFSDGWKQAVDALAPPPPKKPGKNETAAKKAAREAADKKKTDDERKRKRTELEALLLGKPVTWMLEKLNAASWFSDANKLYNSGQKPFRDGLVSPWAMALACEGLAFWAGGASRRLGARARAAGAFPFVTHAAAPEAAGEAGRDLAEVWAPLWARPMTLPEVRTLFTRGRAELRGRGVLTPSAFATAILRRGVDAGISEFRRFVLGRTTSANTFEPRFEGTFRFPPAVDAQAPTSRTSGTALAAALERMLGLIESLPRDVKKAKRWRFTGLRGPIEVALLRLAAAHEDPGAARGLLDAAVSCLDRVDRNRSFREKRVSWQPLPIEWLPALFTNESPTVEARLALALVSGFPASRPFALYRFGVELKYGRYEHTDRPPARWVWGPGALPRVLSTVLLRRTLDWEAEHKWQTNREDPVRFLMPASCAHVSRWLDGALDEDLLARWISRLALFDWRIVPRDVRALALSAKSTAEVDAALSLFGLFQPLFDLRTVKLRSEQPNRDLLDPKSGARTPGAARTLANLIRAGQLDTAVRFASNRYAMARAPLAKTSAPWRFAEPERLLASVLFPVQDNERAGLIHRWLRPQRQKGEIAYA